MRLNIFIALYLIGYFVFTLFANFDNQTWCKVYYIWQSVAFGGVFAWGSIYSVSKGVKRERVKWIFLFSIIMAAWEIIRVFTGWDVNSYWAVTLAFILVLTITTHLVINTNSKLAIFLDKFLFK